MIITWFQSLSIVANLNGDVAWNQLLLKWSHPSLFDCLIDCQWTTRRKSYNNPMCKWINLQTCQQNDETWTSKHDLGTHNTLKRKLALLRANIEMLLPKSMRIREYQLVINREWGSYGKYQTEAWAVFIYLLFIFWFCAEHKVHKTKGHKSPTRF